MNIKDIIVEDANSVEFISLHDNLNPKLWHNNKLRTKVRKQLLKIAKDFINEIGIEKLDIKDITISGSNAAYNYTPNSDLDLHVLVDMSELNNDKLYQELFKAKKTLYNNSYEITIRNVPVELYVQDSNKPVVSLGEYSVLKNKWIKTPKKQELNIDETAIKHKYQKLLELVQYALKFKNIDRLDNVIKKLHQYRQVGLDKNGEFSPENLIYKVLRSKGYITKLYDLKNKLHSRQLSIENAETFEDYDPNKEPPGPEFKPTMPSGTVRVDVSDVYDWYKLGQHISNLKGLGKHDFGKGPPSTILSFGDEDIEHEYIKDLMKTGLTTTDIDPAKHKMFKGQKIDKTYNVKESASGYIPSEKEKNDPRFSMALTVDVKPNTMKKDAAKFGNKISRAGIPPILKASGKL